jgi:hypothetical protein
MIASIFFINLSPFYDPPRGVAGALDAWLCATRGACCGSAGMLGNAPVSSMT